MTGEPPDARDRLARQRLDAGLRRAGRPPERPLHDPGRAVPVDRPRVGGPRRRADRRLPVRRAPRDARSRWSPRRSTGSTASSWARRCRSRRPRRRPARSASFASTRWRCCRSAATTWPTTSTTGCDRRPSTTDAKLPRIFLVNWFRKDDDGQLHLAGLRREQPRPRVGLPPLRGRGRGGRDADRAGSRRRATQHRRARPAPERAARAAHGGRRRTSGSSCPRWRSTWRASAIGCRTRSRRSSRRWSGVSAPTDTAARAGRCTSGSRSRWSPRARGRGSTSTSRPISIGGCSA